MRNAMRLLLAMVFGVTMLAVRQASAIGEGDPVKLSINVAGEYTDNRDSLPDGEENFDFFLTPKIEAQFKAVQDRTVLTLFYAPSYRYRTDPSDIQNDTELQHDLGIELKHKLVERWSIRAKEHFNLTDDPAVVEQGITLRRDSSFTLNRAELETAYRLAAGTDLSVLGQHWLKMYEEKAVAKESDEESFSGRIRLWKAFLPDFGMMLEVTGETWDYDSARGIERGFTAYAVGLGLEKVLGAALKGSVHAGWKTLSYDNDAIDDNSAPYVQALLRLSTPSEQLAVTAYGIYAHRNSDVWPYASQEYTGGRLDVDWRPASQWTLGAGGGYQHGEYEADKAPFGYGSGSEDRVTADARIAFALSEKTSIQLQQSYEDLDTDLATSWSFTRNATRLTFSKQF